VPAAVVVERPGSASAIDRERDVPSPLPTKSRLQRPTVTTRGRRRATWIGLGALILFWAWIGWPYFHSIVVRDAAVTTWLNVATAPIGGDLDGAALRPGTAVGPDGFLARIVNPRADRVPLERALGDLAAAEARLAQVRRAQEARTRLGAAYAAAFQQQLAIRLAGENATLRYVGERLAVGRADASRFSSLREAGSASRADAEAATAGVATLEGERVAAEGALARTEVRRASAERGMFLLDDGSPSSWEAQLDALRVDQEFVAATAELATARAVAEATRRVHESQHTAILIAPPGAHVWQRLVAPGAAVNPGTPIGAWIDPDVLLVDVPLADVTAALLRPGARANVVFEGERHSRPGVVVLTRGSAAILDGRELAAVAKGRQPGQGQALVRLEPRAEDRLQSPVGRAAYVDFPDVSLFSIIRARVRW